MAATGKNQVESNIIERLWEYESRGFMQSDKTTTAPSGFSKRPTYDIFISGPAEKYCEIKYKSLIKQALPDAVIYDTEEVHNGDWFDNDLAALEQSLCMVVLVPQFPMPGMSTKVGYFYAKLMERVNQQFKNLAAPYIIFIWPNDVMPDYGKKVAERMGYIVISVEECIKRLKPILESTI